MELISLTHGLFAQVDDSDFEYLNQWRWFAHKQRNTYYAVRNCQITKRKRTIIRMHRLILGLQNPKIFCDHIDHNGLNNQRSNLRKATPAQNLANRSASLNSTSKYLGVSLSTVSNKYGSIYTSWKAAIQKDGHVIHIGRFKTEDQAAIAYNEVAIKIHGDFANLNIIK